MPKVRWTDSFFCPRGAIFLQKGNKIEKPNRMGWQLYLGVKKTNKNR